MNMRISFTVSLFLGLSLSLSACSDSQPGLVTGTSGDSDGFTTADGSASDTVSDMPADTPPDTGPPGPWGTPVDELVIGPNAIPVRWNESRTRLLVSDPVDQLQNNFWRGRLIAVDTERWEYVVISETALVDSGSVLLSDSGDTVAWFEWTSELPTQNFYAEAELQDWHFFHWSTRDDEPLGGLSTTQGKRPFFQPDGEALFIQTTSNHADIYQQAMGGVSYPTSGDVIADSSGLYVTHDGVVHRHNAGAATQVTTLPPTSVVHGVGEGFAVADVGSGAWHLVDLRTGKVWENVSDLITGPAFVPDRGAVHSDREQLVLVEGAPGRTVYLELTSGAPKVQELEGDTLWVGFASGGFVREVFGPTGKEARLWRPQATELVLNPSICNSPSLSPDGEHVFFCPCGDSESYQIWASNTGAMVAQGEVLFKTGYHWMAGPLTFMSYLEDDIRYVLTSVDPATGVAQNTDTDAWAIRDVSPDGGTLVLARETTTGFSDSWWRPGMAAPQALPGESTANERSILAGNGYVISLHSTSDTSVELRRTSL